MDKLTDLNARYAYAFDPITAAKCIILDMRANDYYFESIFDEEAMKLLRQFCKSPQDLIMTEEKSNKLRGILNNAGETADWAIADLEMAEEKYEKSDPRGLDRMKRLKKSFAMVIDAIDNKSLKIERPSFIKPVKPEEPLHEQQ
jgi:hypothetical protein